MATRSTIALEFADGTVQQVYCHFDGYLSGIGAQLASDFMDPFKVRDLIDAGDMSSIGSPYSERGEVCPARKYKDINEYFFECQQEEYDYILRNVKGVATWFVRFYATDAEWPVTAAMKWARLESAKNLEVLANIK
jgi:hypothetical protein